MTSTGYAFHPRHVDGVLEEYRTVAETIDYQPPKLGIISGVKGKWSSRAHLKAQSIGLVKFGSQFTSAKA
ncbi:hypothetical protein F5Y16DRAFT_380306 [Xylariaceae sp. FL0255]|nr:hypothetical protein F5Y16DRAFT_380306 [Xylariaceae sp. FL0255]